MTEAAHAILLIPAALLGGILLAHAGDFLLRLWRWASSGRWPR